MSKTIGTTEIPVEVQAIKTTNEEYITGHIRQPKDPQYHYRFPVEERWMYCNQTMEIIGVAVEPSLYGTGFFAGLYYADNTGYLLRRLFDDKIQGGSWNPDDAVSLTDYLDCFIESFDRVLWTIKDSELTSSGCENDE